MPLFSSGPIANAAPLSTLWLSREAGRLAKVKKMARGIRKPTKPSI
jgi:hypothetical protein